MQIPAASAGREGIKFLARRQRAEGLSTVSYQQSQTREATIVNVCVANPARFLAQCCVIPPPVKGINSLDVTVKPGNNGTHKTTQRW